MRREDVFNFVEKEFGEERYPGWCPLEKALDLVSLVLALKPHVIVETGVFGGRSFFPMALAAQANGRGQVIGIDPWSAQASTEGYSGDNSAWWGKQNLEEIYQGFVRNVARLDLIKSTTIFRQKSDDVAISEKIDLAHFDSQHTEMALREVKRFGSQVRIGGVIVMDDISWTNEGVAHVGQAVELLLKSGFIELYQTKIPTGHWGVYQRIK